MGTISSSVLASATATFAFAVERLSQRGIQLTPIRRAVLQLLCRAQKDISAYDLLSAYEKAVGRRASANTIYRALHFLEEHDLVAHLSSTRTYVVRAIGEVAQPSVFFVCRGCKVILECKDNPIVRAVNTKGKTLGFADRSHTIEVQGMCEKCVARLTPNRDSRHDQSLSAAAKAT